jgi:hypothetical protein
MSIKCRNAPQILSSHEVRECARAVAIMVYRYRPEVYHRIISAHEIAEALGNLPGGQLSTFHVDNDTLKKAFANKFLREILKDKFPMRYDFSRSSTVLDVIKSGPSAFLTGYRIIFNFEVEISKSGRAEIDVLTLYIISEYRNHELQKSSSSEAAVRMHPERNMSPKKIVTDTLNTVNVMVTPCRNAQHLDREVGLLKRGRPELSMDEMKVRLNRARMNINYNKSIQNKSTLLPDEESETSSIGSKVARLIGQASVYTEKINGEQCVSIVSGLNIQDLISNCGCSVEKIPMIIGTVLSMLFGDIGETNYSSIVKSHNTYAIASERTSLLVVSEVSQRFVDRSAQNRLLYSTLILDASNKKGKGCVGKIVICVGIDGVVKQLALQLDTTVTKKAVGSSELTIESLENELGDGIVWIMGITTDAFDAAVEEATLVLRHIDIRANQIYLKNPDVLHRKSLVIPEQVYKYGGNFREVCLRTCQMHNFERILSELISTLMGSQGLAYDMTSAQNLYRVNYYWLKYRAMVNTITVESLLLMK